MKKINKQIIEARNNLRKLYIKYTDELFEITSKVDKYLEGLQDDEGNK